MDSISSEMRQTAYKVNRAFGDSFMDQVKAILGRVILRPSSRDEDGSLSYDLTLAKESAYRIAMRIREYRYFEKYPDDFTIRKDTVTGGKTEYEKIVEGRGDYYFYGYANEEATALYKWMVLDLDIFRKALIDMCDEDKKIAFTLKHPTEQNSFYAFNVRDFPTNMVLATTATATATATAC